MTDTTALSAADLREATGEGRLSAMEVAEAFLARIAAEEPGIGAWAYHDPDGVREEARKLDEVRASGQPLGPLHAVPVGLKDIIDTQRMPTENGTVIDKGRVPENDAAVVRRLKEAGALIMGKTVTTELAFYHPAGTRNPHDPTRTPGGSSSGSAAAVAARMVPLAVGTQTNGSVIRPASFCGVVGFKPSFGTIARSGILTQSPPLDQVGVFANCIADAACLSEVLAGYDPADPWSRQGPRGGMVEVATAPVPVKPHFAFVKTPVWDKATSETQEAFGELASMLAGGCEEVPLSEHFDEAWPALGKLMSAGFAHNLKRYYQHGREHLEPDHAPDDRGRRQGHRGRMAGKPVVAEGAQGRAQRGVRALRCHHHPGGAGRGAARAGGDGRSKLLHLVDVLRHAGRVAAACRRQHRIAARGAARRSAGRRCALVAHRALAHRLCQ